MEQTPDIAIIQERMKPGQITLDGFLGTDTRSLGEILAEDDAEVRRMGLSHEAIALRMRDLEKAGREGLGESVSVPPHFDVRTDVPRGHITCPFGHPGLCRKTNTLVRNLKIVREITFSDLNIHMIAEHGFYEGRGAAFRVNPRDLVEILEVKAIAEG